MPYAEMIASVIGMPGQFPRLTQIKLGIFPEAYGDKEVRYHSFLTGGGDFLLPPGDAFTYTIT
jgi:hypothetical protein